MRHRRASREYAIMAKDLDRMSFRELQELELKLKKAKASAEDRTRAEVRAKVEALITGAGFKVTDIFGGRGGKGRTVAAKYANPDDPSETWTAWAGSRAGSTPRFRESRVEEGPDQVGSGFGAALLGLLLLDPLAPSWGGAAPQGARPQRRQRARSTEPRTGGGSTARGGRQRLARKPARVAISHAGKVPLQRALRHRGLPVHVRNHDKLAVRELQVRRLHGTAGDRVCHHVREDERR